ncbi:ectoine/hydroxyectoine ABC transporter substrate-binding protein EhuB [Sinorhizobium medicae]|nr:ectoine/hydroxyectoine ABC transporter substrate-binding protein EhuB [Sinorhizobium medicae]
MKYIKRIALTHLAVATLLAPSAFADDARIQQLKEQGFARISIANEPPFTAVGADGKVSGAGPDVARAVFEKMGIGDVEASINEYGAMIPGLQAKRFDAITAGLYMKPERCNAVAYSQPILCDGEGFLVKKELEKEVTSYEAVAKTGLQIGVLSGSSEEKYAIAAGVPRANITIIPDGPSGVKMLRDGRIAVVATTALSISNLALQAADDGLVSVIPVAGTPISCDGAAFNKSDTAVRDAFDVELANLKKSGEFARIVEPYGFSAKSAMSTTRAELCQGHGPNN